MGDYFSFILLLLAVLVPTVAVSGFVFIFAAEVWIRKKVRGGSLLVFWDSNRDQIHHLVQTEGLSVVFVENIGKVAIDPKKRYFSYYPFGFPKFMQQRVATYYFKVGEIEPRDPQADIKDEEIDKAFSDDDQRVIEPIDPADQKGYTGIVTAKMLQDLTDEAMLSAIVKDAREAAEGILPNDRNMPMYILVVSGIGAIIAGVGVWLGWETLQGVELIIEAILK